VRGVIDDDGMPKITTQSGQILHELAVDLIAVLPEQSMSNEF